MTRGIVTALGIAGFLAASAAHAQEKAVGQQLVVFPLQGVNVPGNIALASTEVLTSALRNQGFAIVDWEAPAAAADAATDESDLTTRRKGEIARELGCTGYVDGKLVRLGTKIRISINKRDLDGKVVDSRESEAKTEDDLVGVLERIAIAFAGDKSVGETLNLDNATMAETQKQAQRFRLESHMGLVIGEMFGVMDTMDTATVLAFDGRLEIKDLLVTLNAGVGIAPADDYDDLWRNDDLKNDDDKPGLQLWLNLDVGGYLSHTPIAPFLGAGVGMFIGGRVHMKEKDADNDNITNEPNDTKYYDSKVGFDLHPTFGVEFLRQASIRIHIEVRYHFDFAEQGHFGHGPSGLAGINF